MLKIVSEKEKERVVYDFALNFFQKQEKIDRENGYATIPAILLTKRYMSDIKEKKLLSKKYKQIIKKQKSA